MGDTADGYPGVKGIGEKTAIKLIQQYGTVENAISHQHELPKGQQTKIKAYYDDSIMSLKLAAIHTEVPLNYEEIIGVCLMWLILDICAKYAISMS